MQEENRRTRGKTLENGLETKCTFSAGTGDRTWAQGAQPRGRTATQPASPNNNTCDVKGLNLSKIHGKYEKSNQLS